MKSTVLFIIFLKIISQLLKLRYPRSCYTVMRSCKIGERCFLGAIEKGKGMTVISLKKKNLLSYD